MVYPGQSIGIKMNIILSISFIILSAIILSKIFCVIAQGTKLMDEPNDRSMHTHPTVRGGGLVFIGLSLCSIPYIGYLSHTPLTDQLILMVSIILLATVCFIDDLYHLSAKSRFLVQCLVALIVTLFMRPDVLDFVLFSLTNKLLIIPFLFFAVIWAINHFNFMDGLDGFCAFQAVFLLAVYVFLLRVHPALMYQDFCLVLICSLSGFLVFNFPPAKIFMGDIGSACLGFITFMIAVIAQKNYHIPIVYWFILNGLFLFDATLTLFRRILHKEQWSAPHRKHAYQRLKQLGAGSRVILLGQLLINLLFFILVVLLDKSVIYLGLALIIQWLFMLIIYCLIERSRPMFNESGRVVLNLEK